MAETSLTLVTYNIHIGVPMGGGIGERKVLPEDLDNIADVLTQTRGDVIALQEVDCEYGLGFPSRRRSNLLNEARYLAAALENYKYIFGSAQDDTGYPTDNGRYLEWGHPDRWMNNGEDHGEVGNALLWNAGFKLAAPPENLQLPKDQGQERRAAIYAQLAVPGSNTSSSITVTVYATHLQHDNGATRYAQMKAILDHASEKADADLVLIMGDLNHELDASETSNPIQLALDRGFFDLAAPSAGDDVEDFHTFPTDAPDRRIDFVLSNRPVKVLEKKVLRSLASDHLPVAVTIAW